MWKWQRPWYEQRGHLKDTCQEGRNLFILIAAGGGSGGGGGARLLCIPLHPFLAHFPATRLFSSRISAVSEATEPKIT